MSKGLRKFAAILCTVALAITGSFFVPPATVQADGPNLAAQSLPLWDAVWDDTNHRGDGYSWIPLGIKNEIGSGTAATKSMAVFNDTFNADDEANTFHNGSVASYKGGISPDISKIKFEPDKFLPAGGAYYGGTNYVGTIPENIVMGYGMSGLRGINDTHDANKNHMWLCPAQSDISVVLDLKGTYPLSKMYIWNYNEAGKTDAGLKDIKIFTSVNGTDYNELKTGGYPFVLSQAGGSDTEPYSKINAVDDYVNFNGLKARYIKITADSTPGTGNYGSTSDFGLSQIHVYDDQSNMLFAGIKASGISTRYAYNDESEAANSLTDAKGYYNPIWNQPALYLNGYVYFSVDEVHHFFAAGSGIRTNQLLRYPVVNGEVDWSKGKTFDWPAVFDSYAPGGRSDFIDEGAIGPIKCAGFAWYDNSADDGYIYCFGSERLNKVDGQVVARVKAADFENFNEWRYWDGTGWSRYVDSCKDLVDVKGNPVHPTWSGFFKMKGGSLDGKYINLYMEGDGEHRIMYQYSDSITGPYSEPIYLMSAGTGIKYVTTVVPFISKPGEFIFAYIVKSQTLRFFRVTDASNITPADPQPAANFSDDFNDNTINPAWFTCHGTWKETGNVIQQQSVVKGDPKKLLVANINTIYNGDCEISAKVKIDEGSWANGGSCRAGVSLCVDGRTGQGYSLMFNKDHSTLQFQDESDPKNGWGPSYHYDWDGNTWYNFRLKMENGKLYGKVWQDGTAEPANWPYTWTRKARSGYPALNAGVEVVSFDDVAVSGVESTADNPKPIVEPIPAEPSQTPVYTENFDSSSWQSKWSTVSGTWSLGTYNNTNILQQTDISPHDPKKAILSNSGVTLPKVITVNARVRVDSWTDGDSSRAGIGVCTGTDGKGYNLVFHNNSKTVQFLDDGKAWSDAYTFDWAAGKWYNFKLKIEDGVLYGKVWEDGTSEPKDWPYVWSRMENTRTGNPSLNGSSANATVSFKDFSITTPAPFTSVFTVNAATGEENLALHKTVLASEFEVYGNSIVANDVSVVSDHGAVVKGTLTATSDTTGAAVTFNKVSDPAHGTVTVATDGAYTYSPTPGYSGIDSFTFQATDGTNYSNIATVSILVNEYFTFKSITFDPVLSGDGVYCIVNATLYSDQKLDDNVNTVYFTVDNANVNYGSPVTEAVYEGTSDDSSVYCYNTTLIFEKKDVSTEYTVKAYGDNERTKFLGSQTYKINPDTDNSIVITSIGEICGAAKVGKTVTAGALSPADATADYQWQISTPDGDFYNIYGATSNTYIPVASDAGKFIRVVAAGTGSYSGTAVSTRVLVDSEPVIDTTKDKGITTFTVKVTATAGDATGTAAVKLAPGTVEELVKMAVDTEATGQKALVKIKVEAEANVGSIVTEIPRDAFNKLSDRSDARITVDTGIAAVSLDAKALSAIRNNADSGDISISVAKADHSSLAPKVRKKVGDRPVYYFTVKAGSSEISDFIGGKAEISIPYTLKSGEKKNSIVVYYVDNSGQLKSVRGRYVKETGTVDFTVSHF